MLGDDLDEALDELRAQAESRMRDTCVITREDPTSPEQWNPATLQYEPAETQIYEGKCRLRAAGTQDHAAAAGDQTFTESQLILSLPIVGSEAVRKDDKVTITAAHNDAALVGVTVWIDGRRTQSAATARRLPVRETQ